MTSYDSSAVLNLGTLTATAINAGRSGVAWTFAPSSTVNFTSVTVVGLTITGASFTNATFNGTSTFATGGSILINGTTTVTMGSGTFTSSGAITTSGNISTTGSGTITSAGLLTASNNFTLTSGIATFPVGLVSAPSVTFAGHTGDGLYWDSSASSPAITSGGADRFISYHLKSPLTNNASASIIRISGLGTTPVAGLVVSWVLTATDGTTNQCMTGTSWFAAQQTSGTVGANVAVSESLSAGAGSLTAAWSAATGVAGQADLSFTPASSLTTTLIQISMNVTALNSANNTITFL